MKKQASTTYKNLLQKFQASPTVQSYFYLKEEFIKQIAILAHSERQAIWDLLAERLVKLIKEEEKGMVAEMWALQKIALQQQLFLSQGQFSSERFESIVRFSVQLKEFEWAENFIENYAVLLPAQQKEVTLTLSWAYYHFYKDEFEKVINLLLNINFTDISSKERTRILLLKSYYELIEQGNRYYESFLSLTYSFEKAIRRRNAISELEKRKQLEFIKRIRTVAKKKLDKER